MYADLVSESMNYAIKETKRKREIQDAYNKEHGITSKTIIKDIRETISIKVDETIDKRDINNLNKKDKETLIIELEEEMKKAAKEMDFQRAIELRNALFELKSE